MRSSPDTMHRINKPCPHCGSLMVDASREYKWKCYKCNRYELNPIEVSHPLEAEMYGHQISIQVLEMRTCTECGKQYEARITARGTWCKRCYNRITDKDRRAKKKQEAVEKAA